MVSGRYSSEVDRKEYERVAEAIKNSQPRILKATLGANV